MSFEMMHFNGLRKNAPFVEQGRKATKNLEIEMTKIIFFIRCCMITFLLKRIKFPGPRTSRKKIR